MEKELKFEIKLTAKDLWQFSMYHANSGFMGIFNVLFSVTALVLLVTRWSVVSSAYRFLLLVCVLTFTVWQPLLLFWKAAKQAKSEVIKQPMNLTFSPQGLMVEQNDQQMNFTWEQMGRMDGKPSMVILYMDRVHAYLLPKRILGDKEDAFYEMVREYLPKEKRRKI